MEQTHFRKKVYFLQFISAVLVVMIHTFGTKDLTKISLSYNIEYFLSYNIASVAVPLFFCLSGFLFYKNFSIGLLFQKWKSRAFTVFIPYLIWNFIYYVYFFFITRLGITNEEPVHLDVKTFLSSVFCFRYNEVFWFMFQLIVFILIAPILYYLLNNKVIGTVFLITLCGAYIFNFDGFLTTTFVRFQMTDSLFFYTSGAFLGLHFSEYIQKEKSKHTSLYIGIATLVTSQVVVYAFSGNRLSIILTKMLLLAAFYYLSDLVTVTNFPEWLICSFPIYTVHEMILEVFNKFFAAVIPDNSNLILIDYFVSPFITVLMIIAGSHLIRKKTPCIYRVLWGKR